MILILQLMIYYDYDYDHGYVRGDHGYGPLKLGYLKMVWVSIQDLKA